MNENQTYDRTEAIIIDAQNADMNDLPADAFDAFDKIVPKVLTVSFYGVNGVLLAEIINIRYKEE